MTIVLCNIIWSHPHEALMVSQRGSRWKNANFILYYLFEPSRVPCTHTWPEYFLSFQQQKTGIRQESTHGFPVTQSVQWCSCGDYFTKCGACDGIQGLWRKTCVKWYVNSFSSPSFYLPLPSKSSTDLLADFHSNPFRCKETSLSFKASLFPNFMNQDATHHPNLYVPVLDNNVRLSGLVECHAYEHRDIFTCSRPMHWNTEHATHTLLLCFSFSAYPQRWRIRRLLFSLRYHQLLCNGNLRCGQVLEIWLT